MDTTIDTRPATFSDFMMPIVYTGIVGGVLSTVPCINWLNACCCLWIVLGGGHAVRMTLKAKPEMPQLTTTVGQVLMVGALVGLLAGMITTVGSSS